MDDRLTAPEKITATKIRMSEVAPFFSYIVAHLTFESKEDLPMPTIGVNARGNCVYDTKYIEGRNIEELTFDLSHEAMHVALEHCLLDRVGTRDPKMWNIAVDLVVNNFMISSGIYTKEEGIVAPDDDGKWSFIGKGNKRYHIDKIGEKTAEDVYDFLEKNAEPKNVGQYGKSKDNHMMSNGGDKKKDSSGAGNASGNKEKKEGSGNEESDEGSSVINDIGEKDWKSILAEAAEFAKGRGVTSKGIDRIVENALKSKRNWKKLLNKYIMSNIPNDFTYTRPSKRFVSTDMYFPAMKKESITVAVAIDTSGSISQRDLGMFLGEVYNILGSFNDITLTYMMHDSTILKTKKYTHSNLHEIKREKTLGGGGTSHKEIFEWANKNKPETLLCFTDGDSDIPECKRFRNTIWMLTSKDRSRDINFGTKIFFDKHLS